MSGPKISIYSLTGRMRTIALGQVRCEGEIISCYSQILNLLKEINALTKKFDTISANILLMIKRGLSSEEEISRLESVKRQIEEEIKKLQADLPSQKPQVSVNYTLTEEAYTQKKAEAKKIGGLKKRAEKLKARLEEEFNRDRGDPHSEDNKKSGEEKDGARPSQIRDIKDKTVSKIQKSIIEDINASPSFFFDDDGDKAPDTDLSKKKDETHKLLSELLNDGPYPDDLAAEIKNAVSSLEKIADMNYLNNFCSITVSMLIKKADEAKKKEKQRRAEFEELLARYESLCEMAEEKAKPFPYSDESFTALSSEIERLEMLLVRIQEQTYISECVDEVMADMGYDLIGSREVRKKSGKRFRSELFTFNEGTAVNVTFSSDGHISMELGGLARTDRIPSEEEAEILTHDMESFCGEFAEFEKRMLAKGIVVGKRISISPPTAEHASIINVSDYNISDSTQISEINAPAKRHKQKTKKQKRKSE